MISDMMTFLQTLPQSINASSVLPDSFDLSGLPVDSAINMLAQIDDSVKLIGAAISLIIALLGCFFGYKLCKVFMSITGFIVGAIVGGIVAFYFLNLTGALAVLCIVLGGILIAVLAYRIYMAGIFILCFGLSFMAAASVLPFSGDIQFFLATLVGFIIGSLALKYIRPVIILTSALVCGSSAGGLLITVCEAMGIYTFSHIGSALLTVIICILGITVQFLTTTDPVNKQKKKRAKHSRH